jgi:hypothetical protein
VWQLRSPILIGPDIACRERTTYSPCLCNTTSSYATIQALPTCGDMFAAGRPEEPTERSVATNAEDRLVTTRTREHSPSGDPKGEEFREDSRPPIQPRLSQRAPTNPPLRRLSARNRSTDARHLAFTAAVLQTCSSAPASLRYLWSWPVCCRRAHRDSTARPVLSHDAAHYRLFENRGSMILIGRICASAADSRCVDGHPSSAPQPPLQ